MTAMNDLRLLSLGLNLAAPWRIEDADLDLSVNPHHLRIDVTADRGARYPCPRCGELCPAHDFNDFAWQHLNFFQHTCTIHARVPRVKCAEHGVHRAEVPWARPQSGFTLLFEEMMIALARKMAVADVATHMHIEAHRIWRVIDHYVTRAVQDLDLREVAAIALDETACKKGQQYVTVFLDMDRPERPVIFATQGRDSSTVAAFVEHLERQGGTPENVARVVCDMSAAFHSGIRDSLPDAAVTVDWFHVVKHFNDAVDKVRQAESQTERMPKAARWALRKRGDGGHLSAAQVTALRELEDRSLATATAYQVKEQLAWVNEATSRQGMLWRISAFVKRWRDALNHAVFKAMRSALEMLAGWRSLIANRKASGLTNARLESLNSVLQTARRRARGYRNPSTFITMIYLIAADIPTLLIPRYAS